MVNAQCQIINASQLLMLEKQKCSLIKLRRHAHCIICCIIPKMENIAVCNNDKHFWVTFDSPAHAVST